MTDTELAGLARRIKAWGRELGFQQVGIAGVDLAADEALLERWLADGRHGEMAYMERHGSRRARPAELVPGTLRVISARMDYLPEAGEDPWRVLDGPGLGYVSRYAWDATTTGCSGNGCNPWPTASRPPRDRSATGVHGQRAGHGKAACARRGPGLDRQAHQPDQHGRRIVVLPGRDLYRPGAAHGPRGGGPLRHLPRLHRRLPHRRHHRAVPARCPALRLLPHHRLRGSIPAELGRSWATESTAATTASSYARGTATPASPPRTVSAPGTTWTRRRCWNCFAGAKRTSSAS